jgi:hypothetical protein
VISVNGITGQGAFILSKQLAKASMFTLCVKPTALYYTCLSLFLLYRETRIGEDFQMGMMKKWSLTEP